MITRLGSFCFRRRWLVSSLWLVALVVGVLAAGPVFTAMSAGDSTKSTDAAKVQEIVTEKTGAGTQVVAVVDDIDPGAGPTRSAIAGAITDLRAIQGVKEVGDPAPSRDGRAVALTVTTAKSAGAQEKAVVTAVQDRLRTIADDVPGSVVELGGLVNTEANALLAKDLQRAEFTSLPVMLVVLIFVFGGVIAAGLPVLAGIGTIAGALGLLWGFSKVVDLNPDIVTVVTLLGLGLSIDYGLLLVARYREELAAGHAPAAAIGRTWATAGRTIAFSALTVAAALTGLLAFDLQRLKAMGAAGISVSVVAMVAALTLTAALIGVFRKRIRPSRKEIARLAAIRDTDGTDAELERGFFARLAKVTQRVPALIVLGCLALLVAASLPLLHMNLKLPVLEVLPRSLESVRVADDLANRFALPDEPAVRVHARTDPATLDAWARRWEGDPGVREVPPATEVFPGFSSIVLITHGDAQGEQARELARHVDADRPPGVESFVSGSAVTLNDLYDRLVRGLPLGIGITVLAMFVLLFLMTGSLVVPVKAIVMNIVSLGVTFGVLIAIFQYGYLSGPLDTLTIGGMSPYTIVIVFAFAFGLSMDYEVFLLSRVKEFVDGGQPPDVAVRHGLQVSGRLITSAAVLMLITFGAFGAAQVGTVEQIGIGLFVAVLVDATLVRCLLVPATMTLLGRFAWWAPAPLRWLHARFGLHEHVPAGTEVPVRQPSHSEAG